jgi:hypothetical protein
MANIETLIAAATEEATRIRTIDRFDGTSYQGATHSGSAIDGDFQVYVISAQQRTRRMKDHYRATFYIKQADGHFHRTNRAAFEQALAKEK